MVASSTTTHVPLAASPDKLWPAFKNAVHIIAQQCPQFIQSCELLHGDGGVGSIRLVKFGPASGLVTYAKEEIIEVDEEKMILTYLLLEGDLKKQFTVFKPSISLGAGTQEGHSIATWTLVYEAVEGQEPQVELLNEGAKMFFKLLESALHTQEAKSPHLTIKEEAPTSMVL